MRLGPWTCPPHSCNASVSGVLYTACDMLNCTWVYAWRMGDIPDERCVGCLLYFFFLPDYRMLVCNCAIVANAIPKNHSRLYKRSLQPPEAPCSAVVHLVAMLLADRTTAFQYSTAGLRVTFRSFIGRDCTTIADVFTGCRGVTCTSS